MLNQKIPIKTFDDWVLQFPEAQQDALIKIYLQIKKAAPKASDRMSYGVWCFFHQGMLVGIGAFKNHCSMFVMSYAVAKDKELIKAGIKGSTLQFTPEKPLTAALVKKIVKKRVEENEEKARKKLEVKSKKLKGKSEGKSKVKSAALSSSKSKKKRKS